MTERAREPIAEALGLLAPGKALREGLDRVVQAHRGALVVVGDDPAVLSICTGGFLLDAEFSPQRLSELCKMDGAVILARDASRIARANVHLTPKASIPTSETGTRHRTAERVARSIDVPVISVSEAMGTIAVYRHHQKHTFQSRAWLIDRATQALSTLNRFKRRFDVAVSGLSGLEMSDAVSVSDVVAVLQPGEMVLRIAEEIESHLIELGDDGRLIELQLIELVSGTQEELRLVVRDYLPALSARPGKAEQARDGERGAKERARAQSILETLHTLPADQLLDAKAVSATLGLGSSDDALDAGAEARGYRLLQRLPRISEVLVERLVERFSAISGIMAASISELEELEGVGAATARAVKDGLARMVEASIFERYN